MLKFIPALVIAAGILLFATGASAEQQEAEQREGKAKCTGTFSNMYYNEEGDDLLGEELKIVLGDDHGSDGDYPLIGMYQEAGGGPFDPILVDVRCDGHTVEFTLPKVDHYAEGRFRGTITSKGIHGKMTYPNGAEGDETDLPRRASYWDEFVSSPMPSTPAR